MEKEEEEDVDWEAYKEEVEKVVKEEEEKGEEVEEEE